jgi:hypothetical protein
MDVVTWSENSRDPEDPERGSGCCRRELHEVAKGYAEVAGVAVQPASECLGDLTVVSDNTSNQILTVPGSPSLWTYIVRVSVMLALCSKSLGYNSLSMRNTDRSRSVETQPVFLSMTKLKSTPAIVCRLSFVIRSCLMVQNGGLAETSSIPLMLFMKGRESFSENLTSFPCQQASSPPQAPWQPPASSAPSPSAPYSPPAVHPSPPARPSSSLPRPPSPS